MQKPLKSMLGWILLSSIVSVITIFYFNHLVTSILSVANLLPGIIFGYGIAQTLKKHTAIPLKPSQVVEIIILSGMGFYIALLPLFFPWIFPLLIISCFGGSIVFLIPLRKALDMDTKKLSRLIFFGGSLGSVFCVITIVLMTSASRSLSSSSFMWPLLLVPIYIALWQFHMSKRIFNLPTIQNNFPQKQD